VRTDFRIPPDVPQDNAACMNTMGPMLTIHEGSRFKFQGPGGSQEGPVAPLHCIFFVSLSSIIFRLHKLTLFLLIQSYSAADRLSDFE